MKTQLAFIISFCMGTAWMAGCSSALEDAESTATVCELDGGQAPTLGISAPSAEASIEGALVVRGTMANGDTRAVRRILVTASAPGGASSSRSLTVDAELDSFNFGRWSATFSSGDLAELTREGGCDVDVSAVAYFTDCSEPSSEQTLSIEFAGDGTSRCVDCTTDDVALMVYANGPRSGRPVQGDVVVYGTITNPDGIPVERVFVGPVSAESLSSDFGLWSARIDAASSFGIADDDCNVELVVRAYDACGREQSPDSSIVYKFEGSGAYACVPR